MGIDGYVPSADFIALKAAVLALDNVNRGHLHTWMSCQMSPEGKPLFPNARTAGSYIGMIPAAILEMTPQDAAAFYRWYMRWIDRAGRVREPKA